MTVDRTPKPCLHPVVRHEHGQHMTYVNDGCRCLPCLAAHNAYNERRRRMIAYGRWDRFTPSGPVRAHVEQLRRAGMGIKAISAVSGVSIGSIGRLLYGRPAQGIAPSVMVRSETARKLLAVRPRLEVMTPGMRVDGTGARRRLEALMAIGWSRSELARQIGCSKQNVWFLMQAESATVAKVRMVLDLYDRLWDQEPPAPDARARRAVREARQMAAANGWAPPMAWDEDTIDDPAAEPQLGGHDERRGGRRLHVDDVVWFLEDVEPCATSKRVDERFGVSPGTAQQALRRAGRRDLLDRLTRNGEAAA